MTTVSDEEPTLADVISTLEGLKESFDRSVTTAEGLRSELAQVRADRQADRRTVRILAVLGFLGLLVVGYTVFVRQDRAFDCLQTWADRTSSRNNTLVKPAAELRRAQTYVFALRANPDTPQDVFLRAVRRVADLGERYDRLVDDNPVPPAPKLDCSGVLP